MLVPDVNQWRIPKQIALFHSPPASLLRDHLEQQLIKVAKKGLATWTTWIISRKKRSDEYDHQWPPAPLLREFEAAATFNWSGQIATAW